MADKKLFQPYSLGALKLANRMVMAPMTRSRATDQNKANALMATYYQQRAGAGLIITEGVSPSPNGLGYPRIPGIYNQEQADSWKQVTASIHEKGGKIFLQLMHSGRIGHPLNLPEGGEVLGPSAVKAAGQMYTDAEGMKDNFEPRAMTTKEVYAAIAEYVKTAELAIAAGFDGVELHGANGYLIEQFLNPHTNLRDDEFGGSVEKRAEFLLDITEKVIAAIGAQKVGVRLSPNGAFNDMPGYPEMAETYHYIAQELDKLGVAYIHLLDHSAMGSTPLPADVLEDIRKAYKGTLILCGNFDKDSAEEALQNGTADLIAFGKPFLANPDLVTRYQSNAALNVPDMSTFYTPGEKGYTDYPFLE
jgi:N-ethylmaleimide reductase